MLFLKFEMDDGHLVKIDPSDGPYRVVPLGLAVLQDYLGAGGRMAKRSIPIGIESSFLNSTGPTHNHRGPGSVGFEFHPNPKIEVFALVEGGWLPVVFAQAELLLPDANVAKKFRLFRAELSRKPHVPPELAHLDIPVARIHPILTALEGNKMQFPTLEELSQEMHQTADRLANNLASSEVVHPDEQMMLAAYRLSEERKMTYEKEAELLKYALPRLANRIPTTDLERVHDELHQKASALQVSTSSILYYLLLDSLYDNHPVSKVRQSPGRGVLKPKPDVTDEGIYNALFDVFQLELLVHMHKVPGAGRGAICTMDHSLAKAWAMLGLSNFAACQEGGQVSCNMARGFAVRMPNARRAALSQGPANDMVFEQSK